MGESLRRKHLERHTAQAAKTFAAHRITKRGDRRWLLQRVHELSGRPDWTFAAEVVVLEGGAVYVGGDIERVVFAHGPEDPVERLRWMGECTDLDYYVRQKANIGLRHRQLVDVWDAPVASDELHAHIAENEGAVRDADALEDALRADTQEEFRDAAGQALGGSDTDAWDTVCDMGSVLAPAVIYAHAALARLCALLREEEAVAAMQEVAHG